MPPSQLVIAWNTTNSNPLIRSDPGGHYWFSTLEPGQSRPGGAPFFAVTVFARGLLNGLFTRIYLPCDQAVLDADPLLSALGAQERRAMVAAREADGSLRFDVHLQGPLETPFLAFPGHSGYGSPEGPRR